MSPFLDSKIKYTSPWGSPQGSPLSLLGGWHFKVYRSFISHSAKQSYEALGFNSSSSGPRGNSAFISVLWPKDKQSRISFLTPLWKSCEDLFQAHLLQGITTFRHRFPNGTTPKSQNQSRQHWVPRILPGKKHGAVKGLRSSTDLPGEAQQGQELPGYFFFFSFLLFNVSKQPKKERTS